MTFENWTDLKDLQTVADAQSEGWEIEECYCSPWHVWGGKNWRSDASYRGRPNQPKTKTVKMGAYFDGVALFWYNETYPLIDSRWTRIPSEDKTIEVPVKGV